MKISYRMRQVLTAFVLIGVLLFSTACNATSPRSPQANTIDKTERSLQYGELARGDSPAGQDFGNWVVKTSKGLIKDAFVRGNNQLGAVISPQVRPNEVKALAQSLAQGFHKKYPNEDLNVLMYAPDKKLILTARYDARTKQIDYQAAS